MAQLAGEQVHSRPALPCARCGVEQALRIYSAAKGIAKVAEGEASTEGVNSCRQDRAEFLQVFSHHSFTVEFRGPKKACRESQRFL